LLNIPPPPAKPTKICKIAEEIFGKIKRENSGRYKTTENCKNVKDTWNGENAKGNRGNVSDEGGWMKSKGGKEMAMTDKEKS
jgi:hypothetical protein